TALDGNICGTSIHPNPAGDPVRNHASRNDMIAQFFNRSAYVLPVIGTYGAAGRGLFSGPAQVVTDFAILKDIRVFNQGDNMHRFQLRAEFTNLFNQVNFSNPVANLANATYGRITGSAGGRAVQIGLKYLW
ncbi:MAG: hypothetical protein ACRD44_08820, partial [Bryobacteraceae bacterium]